MVVSYTVKPLVLGIGYSFTWTFPHYIQFSDHYGMSSLDLIQQLNSMQPHCLSPTREMPTEMKTKAEDPTRYGLGIDLGTFSSSVVLGGKPYIPLM